MPRKLSINYIRKELEKEGYVLLSENYTNQELPLYFICPRNHGHRISWRAWRSGQRCGKCRTKNYNDIKRSFDKENYILLTRPEDYITAKSVLHFICPKNHEHKISWERWQRGERCGRCKGNIKVTFDKVKYSFERESYTLLEDEYKNSLSYLKYRCPVGHLHSITWGNWTQGYRCKTCFGTPKKDITYVSKRLNEEGYILITQKYYNNKQKIKSLCPNGHEHIFRWDLWQRGSRCKKCMMSGLEKQVLDFVKTNTSHNVISGDRSVIINPDSGWPLELDIHIPDLNIAIEVNGDYWHRIGTISYYNDKIKSDICKEHGIDLLVIKESDWKKNRGQCKNIILELLNNVC